MNGYHPRMRLRSLLVYRPFDDDVARNNHVRKDERHCQPCLPIVAPRCALASRWISQWTSPHFRRRLSLPKKHDQTSLEPLPFVSQLSFLRKCKEHYALYVRFQNCRFKEIWNRILQYWHYHETEVFLFRGCLWNLTQELPTKWRK